MQVENWEIYIRSLYDCKFLQFSTYIFSADITPEMLKLCRVTKVKVFFLVLVYVFNFDLFEFSAAILEKGLLIYDKKRGVSDHLRQYWNGRSQW